MFHFISSFIRLKVFSEVYHFKNEFVDLVFCIITNILLNYGMLFVD